MIALFFALFAQTAFTDFVAKSLHVSPEAVDRSLGWVDQKHFATIDLTFATGETCTTTYACHGTWNVARSKYTIGPRQFNQPLGSGYPTYLLVVAVDRHHRPLWFTTIDDFRFVEVPPTPDGKTGFSISALPYAKHTLDIPTNIGARALQIYSPANCGKEMCLNFNGTASLR